MTNNDIQSQLWATRFICMSKKQKECQILENKKYLIAIAKQMIEICALSNIANLY